MGLLFLHVILSEDLLRPSEANRSRRILLSLSDSRAQKGIPSLDFFDQRAVPVDMPVVVAKGGAKSVQS
jgi:hypothetical protein